MQPVIGDGPYGYPQVNVAQQRRDPDSLLNWTERIIRMRKEVPEIGFGDFTLLETGRPQVLGLRYDWRNNAVLCLHNLAGEPIEATLPARATGTPGLGLVDLLGDAHSEPDARGRHRIMLEAYGYRWYRVGGLDYILKRSEA
ncbi:MAG: alpha-glucosidase C-terminal domain-containing protein [Geminicoccaceae bacterium]